MADRPLVHKPVNLDEIHDRWTGTLPAGYRPTEDIDALITEIEYLRGKLSDFGEWPECAECGCTDSSACLGGCSWVPPIVDGDPPLCSVCVEQSLHGGES